MTATGLAGRNVLVTGARGFIGANLRHALNAAGANVTATSRSPNAAPGETWRVADLATPESAARLLNETAPDVIFHLSGYVTGARGVEHVVPALQGNFLDGLHLMLAAQARKDCRIVLANSLEEPSQSEGPLAPSSPYAAAKTASTTYARMFHALYDAPISIGRIAMGYGPRQSDLKKVVPYLVLSALQGQEAALSSGERVCDWVFADDIVGGLIACAVNDGALGQALDIASGELASVRQVAQIVAELVPGAPPAHFGAIADRKLDRTLAADVDHTFACTGWRASTRLRDGLAQTIEYYRGLLARGPITTL